MPALCWSCSLLLTQSCQHPPSLSEWQEDACTRNPDAQDHPDWSIITKTEELANKAVVMKAIIRNSDRRIIATARKKETEIGFPDYIEKAETGAVGRTLAMCGYGTLQAPEFDEGERIADSPIETNDKGS